MCPAVYTASLSWLCSSSTLEQNDPLYSVVFGVSGSMASWFVLFELLFTSSKINDNNNVCVFLEWKQWINKSKRGRELGGAEWKSVVAYLASQSST